MHQAMWPFVIEREGEGFGFSAKGTRLARFATLIGLQLTLSGTYADFDGSLLVGLLWRLDL